MAISFWQFTPTTETARRGGTESRKGSREFVRRTRATRSDCRRRDEFFAGIRRGFFCNVLD